MVSCSVVRSLIRSVVRLSSRARTHTPRDDSEIYCAHYFDFYSSIIDEYCGHNEDATCCACAACVEVSDFGCFYFLFLRFASFYCSMLARCIGYDY